MASVPRSLLERALAPRVFLLGVVFAFAACCLAGRLAARRNPYRDFVRFHHSINISTHHYPTASQVLALARQHCQPDKVAVIVSGSSVFHGSGQSRDQVWTRQLQRQLGDDYRVLNLAVPSGRLGEFGAVVVEMLAREHPRLIHLTLMDLTFPPAEGLDTPYAFMFWDAYYKGLLFPRERVKRLTARWEKVEGDAGVMTEMQRQMKLDSRLYFHDLWARVEHEHFSTVWTWMLGDRFLQPRRKTPDVEPTLPPFRPDDPRMKACLDRVVEMCRCRYDSPGEVARLVRSSNDAVPEPLRARTLMMLYRHNPLFIDQVDAEARRCYRAAPALLRRGLEEAGFAVAQMSDLVPADYVDTVHLSVAGGDKLAAQAAPQVRQLARALGYVKEDGR